MLVYTINRTITDFFPDAKSSRMFREIFGN